MKVESGIVATLTLAGGSAKLRGGEAQARAATFDAHPPVIIVNSRLLSLLLALLFTLATFTVSPTMSFAQMGPEPGSEQSGLPPMAAANPSNNAMPAPIPNLHIPQPVQGSMMASPPYGTAPLNVGFFVVASDPEGEGFLTYSWNFGDGTVSSLPPELYLFHTYQKPGNYVCELTLTTVDGRKTTLFQGILVKPATTD